MGEELYSVRNVGSSMVEFFKKAGNKATETPWDLDVGETYSRLLKFDVRAYFSPIKIVLGLPGWP